MSAKCEHPVELISALLDGELKPDERAEIERRLAECASCRALYADLSAMAAAHRELAAAPPVPERLQGRIRTTLESPPVTKPRPTASRFWRRPASLAAAASVIAAAVLGVLILRGQLKPAHPPETAAPSAALEVEEHRRAAGKMMLETREEAEKPADAAKGAPLGGVEPPAPESKLAPVRQEDAPPAADSVAKRERGAEESAFAGAPAPPAQGPPPPESATGQAAAAKPASAESSERLQDTWTDEGLAQDGRMLRKSDAAAAGSEADAKMLRSSSAPPGPEQRLAALVELVWPVADRALAERELRAEAARLGILIPALSRAPDVITFTVRKEVYPALSAWLRMHGVQRVPDEVTTPGPVLGFAIAIRFVPQAPTP